MYIGRRNKITRKGKKKSREADKIDLFTPLTIIPWARASDQSVCSTSVLRSWLTMSPLKTPDVGGNHPGSILSTPPSSLHKLYYAFSGHVPSRSNTECRIGFLCCSRAINLCVNGSFVEELFLCTLKMVHGLTSDVAVMVCNWIFEYIWL